MNVLIVGIEGDIASALYQQYTARGFSVYGISHMPSEKQLADFLHLDLKEGDQQRVVDWLHALGVKFDRVIHCTGILSTENNSPERSLAELDENWLLESMQYNLFTHIRVAQAMALTESCSSNIIWVSLSAKVGSITDNRLGGWYSYRISKAALNMFIKNLSIEWRRKYANSFAIALHPGTTETKLSQPFKPKVLYTRQQTAKRLFEVIENLTELQQGKLLHWDGAILPW